VSAAIRHLDLRLADHLGIRVDDAPEMQAPSDADPRGLLEAVIALGEAPVDVAVVVARDVQVEPGVPREDQVGVREQQVPTQGIDLIHAHD